MNSYPSRMKFRMNLSSFFVAILALILCSQTVALEVHCPVSMEEVEQQGWTFRGLEDMVYEENFQYATISTRHGNDYRVDCYFRDAYYSMKMLYDPSLMVVPKGAGWRSSTDGRSVSCYGKLKECSWQLRAKKYNYNN